MMYEIVSKVIFWFI